MNLVSLIIFCASLDGDINRTGPIVANLFIASKFDPNTGADLIYLARQAGTRITPLVRLPVTRRDRNVPDLLFVRQNRAIALVNGGLDLREPFFLRRNKSSWQLVKKPKQFESSPGGIHIVAIGDYQIGTIQTMSEVTGKSEYYIFVYGPNSLKIHRAPYGVMDVVSISRNRLTIEVWKNHSGRIKRYKETYCWPFSAKHGVWQLTVVKG